ncbi:hypothetical protein Bbelb_399450 [Branchiostoma belcheri]|nr:hypothetical protein Bbelb_399450 [Branchiostoma belcheri]
MSGRRDYRNLEFEELDSSPEPDEKEQHRLGQENGDDDSLLGPARSEEDSKLAPAGSVQTLDSGYVSLASFSVGGSTLGSRESLADNLPSARSDHDEAQDERRNILTPVQEAVQDSEEEGEEEEKADLTPEDSPSTKLEPEDNASKTQDQTADKETYHLKLQEAARRDFEDYDEFSKKYDSYEKRQRLNTAASTRGEENTKQDDLSGMVLVYACYYCGEPFDVQGERRRHVALDAQYTSAMLVLMVAVSVALPSLLVSGQTTPVADWRPCGDFPWDTDDVTVSCDYTYTDVKRPWSRNPLVLQGRCTVTCPPEADMLVGPVSNPYGDAYGLKDGAYYCNVGNSTWMGSEPVCLGHYDSSTVITDDTNTVRLVGGEFYGCVELYDDVTGQWGPVRGWNMNAGRDNRIFWADLACRDLGFREGLATHAYLLTSGVVSGSSPLRSHYRPFYPSAVPRFVVSQTLPQWEGATLRDAIDRVDRGNSPGYSIDTMCLACAGERDGQQEPKPCGNFPWDTDDVTVSCNYTYTDVKQWGSTEPPIVLQGRCTVTCLPEADMLVGPPYSDDSYGYGVEDGAYYCNVGNSTWMGAEPVCLGGYDNSNVITDDTNTVRLVVGEFYGCVELYDDVTRQWGPVRGWSAYRQDRMSWADLACRNLGFREGLATAAYRLTTSGDVSSSWVSPLQYHYRQSHPFYPSTVPKFVVSQTLPQWENATLHDAIDRVVRGPCPDNDWRCSSDYRTMCLACAAERTQGESLL